MSTSGRTRFSARASYVPYSCGAIRRIVGRLPVRGVRAVAVRHQRVVDALDEPRDVSSVALGDLILDGAQEAQPWITEEALGRTQLRERGLDGCAAALVMLGGPGLRREDELVPAVESRLTGREQTVDAFGTRRDSLHDHFSCVWWFRVSAARILSGRTTVGNRTMVVPWSRIGPWSDILRTECRGGIRPDSEVSRRWICRDQSCSPRGVSALSQRPFPWYRRLRR